MGLTSLAWSPTSWAIVSLPLVYLLGSWALAARRPKDFPPGPPTVLGLGNVLQIPPEKPFLKFTEWRKTYGDILGLTVGSQKMVVLQTAEHVRELFEKRGAIYSDRPAPFLTSKIIHPGSVLFINDPTVKKWRTAMQYMFRPTELKRVFEVQAAHSAIFMRKLLDNPEDFEDHMRHWALATPLSIISGQKVEDSGPTSTAVWYGTQAKWLRFMTPAKTPPVDIFPIMKLFPGFLAGWKREALVLRKHMLRYVYHMLEGAKTQHASISKGLRGHRNESVMSRLITEGETNEAIRMDEDELARFGSGTLDAAVDTVIATTLSCVLSWAAYPEVQKRVQAEVDSIWEDEVPSGEKLAEAKYLRAVMIESMRWRGAAPQAVPHVLTRDDTYRGFRFTKGTIFIINAWGIHMDEKWYEKPEEFNPDRYMENPWGVRPEMRDAAEKENRRPTYNFGAGRRMCPGFDYGENHILIALAKLAWEFDVVAKGPLDLDVDTGYHSDLILAPKSFDVDFMPRSELALKHAIGLGQTPNVVPVTQPYLNGPPRPVEVGWHPVGGLAGKWFAEDTGLGKMITERIKFYPDPTQHWAVLVGDFAHQLWMDENFHVIYTNERYKRDEWRTFPVGETRFNDDAIRRAGESVIQNIRERQPAYNLITNNCQTYALQLLDAIKVDGQKDFGTTLAVYHRLTGHGKVMDLFATPEQQQQQQAAIQGPPSQLALPAPPGPQTGSPLGTPPPGSPPYGTPPPGAMYPPPPGPPPPGMYPYGPGSPPPGAHPYGPGSPPPGPYPYGPGTPPPHPPPGMHPYGPITPPPGSQPYLPGSPPPNISYTPGPHAGTVSYAQQLMHDNTTQLNTEDEAKKHSGERGMNGDKKKKSFFSLSRFTKS
ncbi:cytochrome P450 [Colletotrichum karsti]|uniref:Cytochrome P450 n=1 Tax=Colletotrichum karsti TaxID=1095194 RepID=A0A9P6LMJ8_9PEZI|nr:cytochrome P450 [Colletotrichum karsti]KAF9878281.1 cytochrome P450 [Colletotrichum karsti]